METTAVVISLDGDYATVRTDRKSACDGCHAREAGRGCAMCMLMGDKSALTTRAYNPVGAEVGDTVLLCTSSSRVLGYGALVFLLPLALAFLFYFAADLFSFGMIGRYISAFCGFAGTFVFLGIYSRRVMAVRCDVTVASVVSRAEANGTDADA